jgi:hypothetical protein
VVKELREAVMMVVEQAFKVMTVQSSLVTILTETMTHYMFELEQVMDQVVTLTGIQTISLEHSMNSKRYLNFTEKLKKVKFPSQDTAKNQINSLRSKEHSDKNKVRKNLTFLFTFNEKYVIIYVE